MREVWSRVRKKLHNLYGTFAYTGSAARTFSVIHHRDTVNHFDALLRAVFNAEFALDASGLAVFCHHCFIHVQVGTNGTGAFPVPGNDPDDMLRAFV